MNEYKITYTGESEGYRLIIDRTEAAAKKYFRDSSKDLGRITIQSVELVDSNAMATKRNERETLEIIRQLVADLGEQSYLATAFEGCFEDAEVNIENDFGDSWKCRAESLERKLDEAKDIITGLEANKSILENELSKERQTSENLRRRVLPEDDLEDVRQMLNDRAAEADEKAEKAAAEIVEYAENPDSPDFRQAVIDHRNYLRDAEYIRGLLGRVVAAQAAAHSQP